MFSRYDILVVQQIRKLIFPASEEDKLLFYVNDGELYELLKSTHESIGHGSRVMISELSFKYKNTTRSVIKNVLLLCEPCQQKQKGMKKRSCGQTYYFIIEFNS